MTSHWPKNQQLRAHKMQHPKQRQLVETYSSGDGDQNPRSGNIRNSLLNAPGTSLISQRQQRREQETKELLQMRLENFFASLPINMPRSRLPKPVKPRQPRKLAAERTNSSLQMASQRSIPPASSDDTTDVSVTSMSVSSDFVKVEIQPMPQSEGIPEVIAVAPSLKTPALAHALLPFQQMKMPVPLTRLPSILPPLTTLPQRQTHSPLPTHTPRLTRLQLPSRPSHPQLRPQDCSQSSPLHPQLQSPPLHQVPRGYSQLQSNCLRSVSMIHLSQQRRSRSVSQQHLVRQQQQHQFQQPTLKRVRSPSLSTQRSRPATPQVSQLMPCTQRNHPVRLQQRQQRETQTAPTPVPKPRSSLHHSTAAANTADLHPVCQIFRVTDVNGVRTSLATREDRRVLKILDQFDCCAEIQDTIRTSNREAAFVCISGPNGQHLNWCIDRIHELFPSWELKSQMRKALCECVCHRTTHLPSHNALEQPG